MARKIGIMLPQTEDAYATDHGDPVIRRHRALAQHHDTGAPVKPVALYPGLGVWKHPIATRNMRRRS